MDYNQLIKHLQKHSFISIKKDYSVLTNPEIPNYHITIYRDQWNEYSSIIGKPYHLFHVSSNNTDNRCSSYFWVHEKKLTIQMIPKSYFQYNQPTYSFTSSTRSKCSRMKIISLLNYFQSLLNLFSR